MALVDFDKVKQLFTGGKSSESDQDLFQELFVLVLSRATDADSYTHPIEIDSVQRVVKKELNVDLSDADVRMAAASALYESAPLEKYLANASSKLTAEHRRAIVNGLVEVMKADDHISTREADFFNMVVASLGLSAAEVVGLHVE